MSTRGTRQTTSTKTAPKEVCTFLEDVVVRDHKDEVSFRANRGQVVELSRTSARRWYRRNLAIQGRVKLDKKPAAKDAADSKNEKSEMGAESVDGSKSAKGADAAKLASPEKLA